ncbi:ABC transporter ATP-binding protein [Vibrio tasmaniensis]|uniref:ABC transporter ATP-binding protein n=1 Tax=Vibrio tasmaniensis TaxID=212663 RepID=UPI00107F6390|nr:ABC transporter ATP-binding protein [Vibrio tasmaniensis]
MSNIIVKNLVLDYPIRNKININKSSDSSVGGRIFEKNGLPYLRAIDDISLDIHSGDRVGIIGHNGAGKSTLLKTLAGIYKPTSGSVTIEGKVAPLFNLKFGMDMELSGYENIVLRGLYLGVPKREILQKREEVAKLSDLGDFLYLPMKSYSSGMIARLAFAVSVKIDADILLLDEMIGTGDANFINKTSEMAKGFVENSNILLLASHSNKVIREICNKAIVFEHGKVVDFTSVNDALRIYKGKGSFTKNTDCKNLNSEKYNPVENLGQGDKNYLLVNYVDNSDSFISQAAQRAVLLLMKKKAKCIKSVNFETTKGFSDETISNVSKWVNKKNRFFECRDSQSSIDSQVWESIKEKIRKEDNIFEQKNDYDFIVINLSQNVHNNSYKALEALARILIASEIKPVILFNCSIFNMDESILNESLSKVEFIHSRDNFTSRYLKGSGIDSIVAPDIASVYIGTLSYEKDLIIKSESKLCLISLDVLANERIICDIVENVKSNGLIPVYLSTSNQEKEINTSELCSSLGVRYYSENDINLSYSLNFLGQFEVIISGSHMLNMFSLELGIKLICLPTNNFTVEGSLSYISNDIPVAYCPGDLGYILRSPKYIFPENLMSVFSKKINSKLSFPLNEVIRNF